MVVVARSTPTNFVVEILEGPLAGQRLELGGRSLPYRAGSGGSISFGGDQRSKLTWYPGNPTATQNVFGPTLQPTTINGTWKERYLGQDVPIDLFENFDVLRKTGVQVRVRWEAIVRIGIVKTVKIFPGDPTGGLTDFRWEIVFEWSAENVTTPRKINARDISLRDGLANTATDLDSLQVGSSGFIEKYGRFLGAENLEFAADGLSLREQIELIRTSFKLLSNAAVTLADAVSIPANAADGALSALGQAKNTAAATAAILANIPPNRAVFDDSVPTTLSFELDKRAVIEEALALLPPAYEQQLRMNALARPQTFVKVVAHHGSDLRALAVTYFGDADKWDRIAKANGLETSIIPDDVAYIYIPVEASDALRDASSGVT